MIAIKERPILCKGPEVRALLRGATQLRRIIEPQPKASWLGYMAVDGGAIQCGPDYPDGDDDFVACPYGKPGQRLWVREKWAFQREGIFFAADQTEVSFDFFTTRRDMLAMVGALDLAIPKPYKKPPDKWRPSIHMPRWASRILLELTDVRVERLQEISEADIQAEGVPAHVAEITFRKCYRDSDERAAQRRKCFRELWDSINGPGSWDANPWVWAISFRRVEA